MFVARSAAANEVAGILERTIEALREIAKSSDEPMLNLLAYHDGNQYAAILFPRRAHRPACYFATGPEQLLISPAVLEMCGILVATEAAHFKRIDANVARRIYEEVSISDADFKELRACAN